MVELQLNCQQLFAQVTNMKRVASSTASDSEVCPFLPTSYCMLSSGFIVKQNMLENAAQITKSCDSFLKILSECMLLSTTSMTGGGVGKLPTTPTDRSRSVLYMKYVFICALKCVSVVHVLL